MLILTTSPKENRGYLCKNFKMLLLNVSDFFERSKASGFFSSFCVIGSGLCDSSSIIEIVKAAKPNTSPIQESLQLFLRNSSPKLHRF